ncbi:MAG: archaeal heat shock protein Hsp14 [Thermoplasmataceae archaeon]
MSSLYGPVKYFTDEMMKNVNDRAKEILTYLYPAITMYEENGEIVIEADLPGFDKKDIKVSAHKHSVEISATRKEVERDHVILDQRPLKILKHVHLPTEVDENSQLSAKYQNGVLTVKIPAKGIKSVKIE